MSIWRERDVNIPNNFDDMSFNDKIKLLGFDLNNHANNEEILDKLFLHGKYANQSIENLTSSDLNQKTALSEINNDKKIVIFARLLRKDLISKEYYDTQTWRYQIKSLKNWCKHSIFNQLPGDLSEKNNEIEKLPLPKPLKGFLEEDLAQKDTQTPSPRP